MKILQTIKIILLSILLSGCILYPKEYDVKHKNFKLHLTLTDRMHPNLQGFAIWNGKECWVVLPKNQYPYCLQHEIRHCIEGSWHGDMKSGDDCFH